MKKFKRVAVGSVNLGGMLGRIVEFDDGSRSVETWRRQSEGWVHGRADVAEIMGAPPAMPNRLIEYGIPEEDWPPELLEKWQREQRSKRK